jgi:hypothetical protein
MFWLKQSTAVVVQFGPFLDKTDGITLKADETCITDIDHATTGIFLSKNGGDAAVRHQPVTASVADDYGMMRVTLDATDTGTLGTLRMSFAKAATYLPVWADFMVVPANVWDSLYGADKLQVDAVEISNSSAAADAVEANIANLDAAVSAVGGASAADIADAVWDEIATGHTDAGKAGAQLWTDLDAILADTDEVQAELADGGRTDLLVDGIKAKTDLLNYTGAGASALVKSDVVDIAGAAVNTSLAQVGVNVVTEANIDFGATKKSSITAAVPTAAAIGTDAASKVLVTPAQKLVTDANGYAAALVKAQDNIDFGALQKASIATAVAGTVIEGTTTIVQAIRGLLAFCLGKTSGSGTSTIVFRDTGDTKDRVTMTVAADRDRSAVTLDLT